MRQMSGLLVERGHDAFGFLHLTFQEYFAGRALARLGEEERWNTVYPHLHDPRWREPNDQYIPVIDAAYGTLVRLARAWDWTRLAAA